MLKYTSYIYIWGHIYAYDIWRLMMAFFEKVGEQFQSSINSVSAKTKNAMEASTLSSQLKINEDSLKKAYAELGRAFFDKNKDNIPVEYEKQFADIAKAKADVKETGDRLRAVKKIKVCCSCAAEIGLGVKFCPKCGAENEVIEEAIIDTPANVGKCPSCGAKLKPGAMFCNACGTKVK